MKKRLLSLSLVVCLCFAFAVNSLAFFSIPQEQFTIDSGNNYHFKVNIKADDKYLDRLVSDMYVDFQNNPNKCVGYSVLSNGFYYINLFYSVKESSLIPYTQKFTNENYDPYFTIPAGNNEVFGISTRLKKSEIDIISINFIYNDSSKEFVYSGSSCNASSYNYYSNGARYGTYYLAGCIDNILTPADYNTFVKGTKYSQEYAGIIIDDNVTPTEPEPPSSSEEPPTSSEPPPVIEPPPIVQPPPVAPPDIPKGDGVYVTYDTSVWQGFLDYCLNAIGQSSGIGFIIFGTLTGFWLVVWVIKTLTK